MNEKETRIDKLPQLSSAFVELICELSSFVDESFFYTLLQTRTKHLFENRSLAPFEMQTLDPIVSILTHNNRAEISIARKNDVGTRIFCALYSQNTFTKY